MTFLSALRVALAALLVHKGRSTLTSLGIVIGTGAVIAMVSAAGGARQMLDDRLENVGKSLILIRPGARTQHGALTDVKPLTNDEANTLRLRLRGQVQGVAEVQASMRVASSRLHNCKTMVVGTSAGMRKVRSWAVEFGRFFGDDDLKKQAAVCVLGQTVRDRLFPGNLNPVGQIVRIDQLPLKVIGILGEKGRSPIGGDQDDQIFMPLNTFQWKLAGEESLSAILVSANTMEMLDPVKDEVIRLLREKRRIKNGQDDFDVSSVQEMSELARIVTRTLEVLIAIIASVSLLVGGIGIMNIMLVSVTERTREIGIRMSIGATPGDVLLQFLIEAIALSLLGGLLGIALGAGAAAAMAWAFKWPIFIDLKIVVLAFLVSGGVGVFFGYYPALKASRLDPIEALRYE